MKILLRAAMAAVSIGSIGPAFAGEGSGTVANTLFSELPGVVAQAPSHSDPAIATAQNGLAIQAYAANANHGTWLFAPAENGNG